MPPADGSARHRDRLSMGPGAVLSLAEAAGLLPLADREARAWLRERGLVRLLRGREVVCWADVIQAIREDGEPQAPERRARGPRLARVRLDPI